MHDNLYLLLALPEDATWGQVNQAYNSLMEKFSSEDESGSALSNPLETAAKRLESAWQQALRTGTRKMLSGQQSEDATSSESFCRPKLGQLLVASGLLTLDELDSLLEIQRNAGASRVPLGELLVNTEFLTVQQLDYYLRMQSMLALPADNPSRWGQRLVALGLIDEDKLKVALIEQRTTGCTLRQALINRGWLSEELLDRIF